MNVTIRGTDISYDVDGPRTGVPVVLIHGFPFSREMWKPQVDVLKGSHYVVTYDVRGHGKSSVGDGQYTMEAFVDDLIGLLDHLKLSSVVVAGLSMGGYIALRAVERHPDRFRALILCDTKSEADNNDGKIRRAVQARAVKWDGMEAFAEAFIGNVFYAKSFETHPEAVQTIRHIIESTSPVSVAGTLIALAARTDTTSFLYSLKVPVLILVGQHDAVTPPSSSHAMKERIPHAELHVIPRAGHLSNLENPEEFNRHILDFLARLS
jgi:3-oxoadipate enol-lactonase